MPWPTDLRVVRSDPIARHLPARLPAAIGKDRIRLSVAIAGERDWKIPTFVQFTAGVAKNPTIIENSTSYAGPPLLAQLIRSIAIER